MTTHEQPVFVGYSLLGYSGQAALLIVESKYYENPKQVSVVRSSFKNRLRRVGQLLCTAFRSSRRGRLSNPRVLDELSGKADLHHRAVRLPTSHQGQGRQGSVLTTTRLTPAAYALKGGQTPFFTSPCVEMFLFPFHMPRASITYIFHL